MSTYAKIVKYNWGFHTFRYSRKLCNEVGFISSEVNNRKEGRYFVLLFGSKKQIKFHNL